MNTSHYNKQAVQTPDMMYHNKQHGSSLSPLTKSIDMRHLR